MEGKIAHNEYNVSEARSALSDLVNRIYFNSDRITLTRYGKPAAVLVPVDDAELLEALEDKADLDAVRKVLKNPKPVPWEKAKKQLGL